MDPPRTRAFTRLHAREVRPRLCRVRSFEAHDSHCILNRKGGAKAPHVQVIEDQRRSSAGGQGQTIDADRMRASSRFRAALQIGQRRRHFISWNRTTKETGSEAIQAMALKGQNCHRASATRTNIANSTLPFHEISRLSRPESSAPLRTFLAELGFVHHRDQHFVLFLPELE